jgi:hypothetical protein
MAITRHGVAKSLSHWGIRPRPRRMLKGDVADGK